MERKVANIYEDTRELLNQVKDEFDFKSDDQAVKFLCQLFMADDRNELLKRYIEIKKKAGE
ncbi:hypothetical protein [Paenibacillus sedimenti]|uniref:Uncharacterized protein n=1 Tax=Paenibacillus sedimenti TaxID=2770274 RepID=A0A926KPW5_9BACL|nr:hypothetical protein [Paenibacillus sedimenti]MBD0381307.1 hypothetical protein [Paenibacillus sedimenti]